MIDKLRLFIKRTISKLFRGKKELRLGLYGPPNAGKCLTPDSKIVLYDGTILSVKDLFDLVREKKSQFSRSDKFDDFEETYIQMDDLNITVPSLDPESMKIIPKKVKFVYAQKYKGPIFRVKTKSGRIIEGTPEHPIMNISNAGVNRVKLSELTQNSCVGIASNMQLATNILLQTSKLATIGYNFNDGRVQSVSKFHPNTRDIKVPTVIDDDLVRFVGYVITESSHTQNRIKFTNSDAGLLNDFEYLTSKLFDTPYIKREREDSFEIDIGSKSLTDYLRDVVGLNPGLSGVKELPPQFMGLPDNLVSSLLRVLFDAEGYVPKDPSTGGSEIEYSSKSKKLVEQVQILLNRFNILGRFKEKAIDGELYYSLFIGGSDNHRIFRDKIGFTIEYKKERLNSLCQKGLKRNKFHLPIMGLLEKIRLNSGKTQSEFYFDDKHVARMVRDNKITYHRLKNMSNSSDNELLRNLANSDCKWDQIKSIETIDYDGYVYDITVEDTHTFMLSNGLVSGNSTLANRISKDWLGEEMSQVSRVPHETREVIIKEKIEIKRKGKSLSFNLVDTPGIATKIDYEDFLKFKMSKKDAKARAKEATKGIIDAIKWLDDMDAVMVVLDSTVNPYSQVNITIIGNLAARDIPVLVIANKTDLRKANLKKVEDAFPQYEVVGVSAEKGTNMEELYETLFRVVR